MGNARASHRSHGPEFAPAYALGPEDSALLRLALDLGAVESGGPLSLSEERLAEQARMADVPLPMRVEEARAAIETGDDPLGTLLARIRPARERRLWGSFYTPPALIAPMLDWVLRFNPDRVIDPGCGSGRFAAAALRRVPEIAVVAIDLDPVATLLTRAVFAALSARRATVLQADYTTLKLPEIPGKSAFVGNPPYVRHHDLSAQAKAWAARVGWELGLEVSALAGLHVHFYLATALHARPGDVGCFVTSAEWLDVNYGSTVRQLLLGRLGGEALHLIDPRAVPFADAMTTAVISCFTAGSTPSALRLRLVSEPHELGDLRDGVEVSRTRLADSGRWTSLIPRGRGDRVGPDGVPLRAIARVHRGAVTGANDFFILTRKQASELGLRPWCRPAVTSAEEVLESGGVIRDSPERRLLLNVPADVNRAAHPQLDAYLQMGEEPRNGKPPISQRYIPSHRRPWWYLGPVAAPPIIASYMARQPPVFALNPDRLAIVNIAHGIFPLVELTEEQISALVRAMNAARNAFQGSGRTYHGGLEKFEPREMESLVIPHDGYGIDVPWATLCEPSEVGPGLTGTVSAAGGNGIYRRAGRRGR